MPPTGVADRGPAISHTVNVICEFRGKSQYRIGSVIHSFHLHDHKSTGVVRRKDERHKAHVYWLRKALKAVRNGIVKGLLSATSWHVTYRSE